MTAFWAMANLVTKPTFKKFDESSNRGIGLENWVNLRFEGGSNSNFIKYASIQISRFSWVDYHRQIWIFIIQYKFQIRTFLEFQI